MISSGNPGSAHECGNAAPGFRWRSTRATSYYGQRTRECCTNGMASAPLIELINVTKSFDGERSHALRDASLRIDTGGFIALVGTSGSGKTTALKMINRLIEPDRGEVRFEGEAVASLDAPTLRRPIGYVFHGIAPFPPPPIRDNSPIPPPPLAATKP